MRRLTSTVVVGLLLPLVACSGGSSQQSKEDYIAAADALCEQAESDIEALGDPDLDAVGQLLPDVRAVYAQLRDDLDDLDEPDEDAAEAQAVLTTLDDLLALLDQAIAADEAGDDQGLFDAIEAGSDIADEADRRARQFGFEECGIAPEADDDDDGDEPIDVDADYPVINDPTEADIAALVPVFNEGAGNRFTDDEAYCMVEYLLRRTTLAQWIDADGDGPPDALVEAAALECLSLARIIEIGVDAE